MPFVRVGARTDTGLVRTANEDSILVGRYLWAVADGMGGHAAGDVASQIVVEALAELDRPELSTDDLVRGLQVANRRVVTHGAEHPDAAGLGTTVSGLAEVNLGGAHHWAIFNVGDSRVYRLDGSDVARATIDHSEVEELLLAGQISEGEARSHPARNVITRSIGTDPAPVVDVWVLPQSARESFVICTDGLVNEVDDAEIGRLASREDPREAADDLVQAALGAGGHDNVSVIVVHVERPTDDPVEGPTNPRDGLVAVEDVMA